MRQWRGHDLVVGACICMGCVLLTFITVTAGVAFLEHRLAKLLSTTKCEGEGMGKRPKAGKASEGEKRANSRTKERSSDPGAVSCLVG